MIFNNVDNINKTAEELSKDLIEEFFPLLEGSAVDSEDVAIATMRRHLDTSLIDFQKYYIATQMLLTEASKYSFDAEKIKEFGKKQIEKFIEAIKKFGSMIRNMFRDFYKKIEKIFVENGNYFLKNEKYIAAAFQLDIDSDPMYIYKDIEDITRQFGPGLLESITATICRGFNLDKEVVENPMTAIILNDHGQSLDKEKVSRFLENLPSKDEDITTEVRKVITGSECKDKEEFTNKISYFLKGEQTTINTQIVNYDFSYFKDYFTSHKKNKVLALAKIMEDRVVEFSINEVKILNKVKSAYIGTGSLDVDENTLKEYITGVCRIKNIIKQEVLLVTMAIIRTCNEQNKDYVKYMHKLVKAAKELEK